MTSEEFPYLYFVAYSNAGRHANMDIALPEPIRNIADIRELERTIQDLNALTSEVSITNYLPLPSTHR